MATPDGPEAATGGDGVGVGGPAVGVGLLGGFGLGEAVGLWEGVTAGVAVPVTATWGA
jgi:hypothetical protein